MERQVTNLGGGPISDKNKKQKKMNTNELLFPLAIKAATLSPTEAGVGTYIPPSARQHGRVRSLLASGLCASASESVTQTGQRHLLDGVAFWIK